MGKKTVKQVESEESDDSEASKKSGKIKKLQFEDSDNEYFRTHSRTKTPFFIISEPDEKKEGLDLIREVSEELDKISSTLLPKSCPEPTPSPLSLIPPPSIPLNIKFLPKPTRRDLQKDNEKLLTYKTLPLSTPSNNKTFSFT